MVPEFTTDTFRRFVEELSPFCSMLGMRLVSLEKNFASIMIPFKEELIGDIQRPAIHGGVIASLLDTVGGAAAATTLTSFEERLSTVDLRTDFLLPGGKKDIIADAVITRSGNLLVVAKMTAYQDNRNNIIAEGTGVYNVRRNKQSLHG